MVRVYLLLIAIAVAMAVFAAVDAAFADRSRIRGLPKPAWILLILLVPVVGWVLWFAVGRPRKGSSRGSSRQARPVAPDDDPDFLWKLRRDLDKGDTPGSDEREPDR